MLLSRDEKVGRRGAPGESLLTAVRTHEFRAGRGLFVSAAGWRDQPTTTISYSRKEIKENTMSQSPTLVVTLLTTSAVAATASVTTNLTRQAVDRLMEDKK